MHTSLSAFRKVMVLKHAIPAILLLVSLSFVPAAKASVTLDFVFDPGTGNTTATFSGSWDTWTSATSYISAGGEISSTDLYSVASFSSFDNLYQATGGSIPWSGISGAVTPTSRSGSNWGFSTSGIIAPYGYVAATALSGTIVFADNLSQLGLTSGTSGTITVSGVGNSINWSASTASAVPEPATYALLFGVFTLGFASYRSRRTRRKV